mmetsp:Transcript_32953/g.72832  ORF Transcript_32953/g.72832 Transcript_32953/m.72832 type:complete len:279 (-) Transcript_32953:229-1065(-)
MLVELLGVQAQGLVEGRALVVVQVHGDVHRQAEEARPQLGLPVFDEAGLRLEHSSEEVTVAVLVLAPVLEVLEQGVQLVVRVALQVPVDADVPPVANLLRQVGGVDDELGLEEGVLAVLGQEAQIQSQVEVRHGLVQESGVASLITGHEGEDLSNSGVGGLQATAELLVQQETRELSSARALQELNKNLPGGTLNLVSSILEGLIADEVLLVVVLLELSQHCVQLLHIQVGVHLQVEHTLHFIEVSGVEAGGQQSLVGCNLDAITHSLESHGLVIGSC